MNPLDTIATATLAQSLPLPSGAAPSSHPRLYVSRHTSSTTESILKNGLQKEVLVVVKNTPFTLDMRMGSPVLWNGHSLDFRHISFDVRLVYDTFDRKPVGYVKAEPLEVKQTINERADQVSLSVKLKVLTSQHEDMFFRLYIIGKEASTGSFFEPPLEIYSEPIKVISKPKQAKKRRRTTKKKSLNDTMFDLLHTIERDQLILSRVMHDLINGGAGSIPSSLLSAAGGGAPPSPMVDAATVLPTLSGHSPSGALPPYASNQGDSFGTSSLAHHAPPYHAQGLHQPPRGVHHAHALAQHPHHHLHGRRADATAMGQSPLDTSSPHSHLEVVSSPPSSSLMATHSDPLVAAVKTFLTAFERLPAHQKPSRVHRMLRETSARETEFLVELMHHLLAAPQTAPKLKKEDKSGCSCDICPYQLELDRIDSFYTEFLTTPVFSEVEGLSGFSSLLE